MNNQEVFDKVARHLLTQGRRASPPGGGCFYRITISDGVTLKCAVGALIPDELYDTRLEGEEIYALLRLPISDYDPYELIEDKILGLRSLLEGVDEHLLSDLQNAHDTAGSEGDDNEVAFRAFVFEKLLDIAERYELRTDELRRAAEDTGVIQPILPR